MADNMMHMADNMADNMMHMAVSEPCGCPLLGTFYVTICAWLNNYKQQCIDKAVMEFNVVKSMASGRNPSCDVFAEFAYVHDLDECNVWQHLLMQLCRRSRSTRLQEQRVE